MSESHGGRRSNAGRKPHLNNPARIIITLEKSTIKMLDDSIERHGYKSRADLIRHSIREKLTILEIATDGT